MSRYVGFKIGKVHEEHVFSEYYCGGCGFPVTDHDSFCPECGGAFRESDADDRGEAMTSARDYKMDVLKEQLATSQKTEMLLASENVDLRMENVKLRELVSVVYGYYASGTISPCDLCDAIGCQYVGEAESGCRYRDHFDSAEAADDEIQRRMRDLGIEVTP